MGRSTAGNASKCVRRGLVEAWLGYVRSLRERSLAPLAPLRRPEEEHTAGPEPLTCVPHVPPDARPPQGTLDLELHLVVAAPLRVEVLSQGYGGHRSNASAGGDEDRDGVRDHGAADPPDYLWMVVKLPHGPLLRNAAQQRVWGMGCLLRLVVTCGDGVLTSMMRDHLRLYILRLGELSGMDTKPR